MAIGFGCMGLSHFLSDLIAPYLRTNFPQLQDYSLTSGFFWIVVIAATLGVALSFTHARSLEHVGASKLGSLMVYVLIATIGMNMDILAVFENPGLFLIGFIWIGFHVMLLMVVAKIIKAPYFLCSSRQSGQRGRGRVCTYCSGLFQSIFGSCRCTFGRIRICCGYLWGLYLWTVAPRSITMNGVRGPVLNG